MTTERTVYIAKPHWIGLVWPGLLVGLALSCLGCTLLLGLADPPPGQPPPPDEMLSTFVACSGCIFAVALVWIVMAVLAYLHSEYRVTTQRLILQGGILSQRTTEIYRDRIDSLAMQTSPLGRMFGYGDVVVYSGGQLIQTLRAVDNPEELRRQILGQVNQ